MTITTCTVRTYEMNEYERGLWEHFEDFVSGLYNNVEENEMERAIRDVMDAMFNFKEHYINDSEFTWRIEERSEIAEES